MRVVSLLPAATEIVAALGAGGYLVGVSHECDYPPEVRALPRVTRTRIDATRASGDIDRAVTEAQRAGTSAIEVDVELVARLRPDVIIGQALCPVCAVGPGDLERLVATLMPTPWVVTLHAHTLEGVFADMRKVGEAVELKDEAAELVLGLRYRLDRLRKRTDVGSRHAVPLPQRAGVLVLEWLDPPYVAGHWAPELVEVAVTGITDPVGVRDPHAVEEHLVEIDLAADVAQGTHLDAGPAEVEEEVRDALALGDVGVCAREQHGEVGEVCPGGPHLLAGDDPRLAVALCAAREGGEIGSGTRLAEQLAPLLLVAHHRRQEPQPLLRRAVREQGGRGVVQAQRVQTPEVVGPQLGAEPGFAAEHAAIAL